ncbi:MAG: c-type cytochrome [Gammaproteobacteria bacterium]|jgi:cbb3-type cytochrome oxidase cytochrome c subunit|nr:c-type cytochrome [Gammaproteobacteria bacterium]
MRKGEKGILAVIAVLSVVLVGHKIWQLNTEKKEVDRGIPFYSAASSQLEVAGSDLYRRLECKNCHSLWSVRDMSANVPAPALDGIGSLRDEQWFYAYFSAENPQAILPTRLKKMYKMPSYAHLSEEERKVLASYMASLKVQDWYLEETKKAEFEKLTGKPYLAAGKTPQ